MRFVHVTELQRLRVSLWYHGPFWSPFYSFLTPRAFVRRVKKLHEYLHYRMCGYKMSWYETIMFVLETGLRALEADMKKSELDPKSQQGK